MRAGTLVTCNTGKAQDRISFDDLGTFSPGALAVRDGHVEAAGNPADVEKSLKESNDVEVVDLSNYVVTPGFVDAHAHPLFAGDREPDFAVRQRGDVPPLGMLYTVQCTREALESPQSVHAFWDVIRPRLHTIAQHGTTTLEVKTGYALHRQGEIALLDLINEHKDEPQLPRLIATFLGAHALPPEYTDEATFIEYLIEHLMPVARAHGAVYADAFCERGFFSPAQTRRYLEAARDFGLRLRVHCDEMAPSGAAEMALALGVDAIDHANFIDATEIKAIAERGIVTVACPATIAYLDLTQSVPARELLENGGTVALASDYNPGTSPCFNLQTVAFFGRKLLGLSAAEALYGVTRAAAASLHDDAGILRSGARADFVALQIALPDEFGWQFGGNLAHAVYRNGLP
ncbi:MAG: amidohydrolase family protein, partial [Candidatus Eremiobacteraeota bacterium]|nr:amidohydrolase family protein [Candidatus Eremiobacteraeota bacterium]